MIERGPGDGERAKRLESIIQERRTLLGNVGHGEVKAQDDPVLAAKVGRVRKRTESHIQILEDRLERITFEPHFRQAYSLYQEGYLDEAEIAPHIEKAKRLKIIEDDRVPEEVDQNSKLRERIADVYDVESVENKAILDILTSTTVHNPVRAAQIGDGLTERFAATFSEDMGPGRRRFGKNDITQRFRSLRPKLEEAGVALCSVTRDGDWDRRYFLLPMDYEVTETAKRESQEPASLKVDKPKLGEREAFVLSLLEDATLENPLTPHQINDQFIQKFPDQSLGFNASDYLHKIRLATEDSDSHFVMVSRRVQATVYGKERWINGYFLIPKDQRRVEFADRE